MTADTPRNTDDLSNRLPTWQLVAMLIAGCIVLTILIVVKIPGVARRRFMWGVGIGLIASSLLPFLFPEMRCWVPKQELPFKSRVRLALFIAYMLLSIAVSLYYPAARALGLWSL